MVNKIRFFFNHIFALLTPPEKLPIAIGKWTLALVVLFLSALHVTDFYQSIPTFYLFLYLLFYGSCGLILSLFIVWLLKLLPIIPSFYKVSILFCYLWIFYYLHTPNVYGWVLLAGLIVLPILILFGLYLWGTGNLFPLKNGTKIFWFSVLIFSLCVFILGIFIFFNSGTSKKPTVNYKLKGKILSKMSTLPNPATKGPYKFNLFAYGSGTDRHRPEFASGVKIRTHSVDASRLLPAWKGISGKLRSLYFGFDQKALPMNALVWYPENKKGPLPLVVILHGNHLAQHPSDPGYAYLGELLASKGYLVVSVDENFLNLSLTDLNIFDDRLEDENAARAWLLLKHLQLLRTWNKSPSSFFYNKVDMNRIAIIGHSRGGEAVGHAAVFNKLGRYPDNAKEVFDFNFNIGAVIAIAPVDGQYKPSGKPVKMKDVNYFVLHGAQDMDMQSYGGLSTLKRIEFTKGFKGFKAGLYMDNANHGQFNSSWGRRDGISPGINRFNLKQLMPGPEQRVISSVYISAFLEATLNGNQGYRPLFMDARFGREWLPDVVYLSQFEPGERTILADFEEDVDVGTTTIPGGSISSSGLQEWKEQENKLMWGHELSKAVYLAWNNTKGRHQSCWYSVNFSEALSISNRMLSFSVAESKENKNGKEKPIDFTIELTDSSGCKISFPLSRCSYLQPQIAKNLSKFSFLDDSPNSEPIPDFFHFDIATLAHFNPLFQINNIRQVKFVFNKTRSGDIILDDISLIEY
jgi:dienelactone hydrolase